MIHTRTFTAGLGICVLLGLLNTITLARINADDAPPAAVVVTGAVLGVTTLVGAVLAWQGRRGGVATVVVSRVLAVLLGLPAFVLDAPAWVRVVVAVAIALTVVEVALLVGSPQRAVSTGRPAAR